MDVHLYADVKEVAEKTFSFRFILEFGERKKEETGIIPAENEWRAINYIIEVGLKSLKKPVPLIIHTNIPDEGYYFYVKKEECYTSLPDVKWVNENSHLAFKEEVVFCELVDRGDFYEVVEPAA